jgi:hydrogenase maturation protease
MSRRVLVAGIGNIFQSDDAFGVEVAQPPRGTRTLPPGVRVEDFGIRGVHLAYELLEGLRRPRPHRRRPHGRAARYPRPH